MGEKVLKFKEKGEHIPTLEEVRSLFERFIKKEYTEVRRLEDEKGLYLWEVTSPGEAPGDVDNFEYRRKGTFEETDCPRTEINVTYYMGGVPCGGKSIVAFENGEWIAI